MRDLSFITNSNERQFAKAYFSHDEWDYQPETFQLSVGTSYRPDFKDHVRNVLIEVVGTRQAFSSNRCKYDIFKREYPDVVLEFRSPDGSVYRDKRYQSKKMNALVSSKALTNPIAKYIDDHGTTPFAVAQIVGFSPSTVCRHIKEERGISLESALVYNRVLGIPLPELLPDIFPAQPEQGAA